MELQVDELNAAAAAARRGGGQEVSRECQGCSSECQG